MFFEWLIHSYVNGCSIEVKPLLIKATFASFDEPFTFCVQCLYKLSKIRKAGRHNIPPGRLFHTFLTQSAFSPSSHFSEQLYPILLEIDFFRDCFCLEDYIYRKIIMFRRKKQVFDLRGRFVINQNVFLCEFVLYTVESESVFLCNPSVVLTKCQDSSSQGKVISFINHILASKSFKEIPEDFGISEAQHISNLW